MRRYGYIVALLIGAFVLAATVFRPQTLLAETPTPPTKTLDVTGKGTLTVKYDTAEITLGVTELKETANAAYDAMGAAMDGVVKTMKTAGVKDDEIKTGVLSLNAEYDWKDGTQTLRGFRATNTVTITTQRLDQVANLIQDAVNAGSNQLQGVRFKIKDTDKLLDQALDAAVDDAKSKAERVATRLGAKVGGVLRVSIQDQGGGPIMYDAYRADGAGVAYAAKAAPAPVFSGTTDYTATVSVTFELQ
jgi:uncharacterized protein YggE